MPKQQKIAVPPLTPMWRVRRMLVVSGGAGRTALFALRNRIETRLAASAVVEHFGGGRFADDAAAATARAHVIFAHPGGVLFAAWIPPRWLIDHVAPLKARFPAAFTAISPTFTLLDDTWIGATEL